MRTEHVRMEHAFLAGAVGFGLAVSRTLPAHAETAIDRACRIEHIPKCEELKRECKGLRGKNIAICVDAFIIGQGMARGADDEQEMAPQEGK